MKDFLKHTQKNTNTKKYRTTASFRQTQILKMNLDNGGNKKDHSGAFSACWEFCARLNYNVFQKIASTGF